MILQKPFLLTKRRKLFKLQFAWFSWIFLQFTTNHVTNFIREQGASSSIRIIFYTILILSKVRQMNLLPFSLNFDNIFSLFHLRKTLSILKRFFSTSNNFHTFHFKHISNRTKSKHFINFNLLTLKWRALKTILKQNHKTLKRAPQTLRINATMNRTPEFY